MGDEATGPGSDRGGDRGRDNRPEAVALLANLKAALPDLRRLLEAVSTEWGYEDPIYRLYHQSFKVFGLQEATAKIVDALHGVAPDGVTLNAWFLAIVADGTGRRFKPADNERWLEVTRPIVEAFFHSRFFLELVVKYADCLDHPPQALPSGWAAVLYLYNLR